MEGAFATTFWAGIEFYVVHVFFLRVQFLTGHLSLFLCESSVQNHSFLDIIGGIAFRIRPNTWTDNPPISHKPSKSTFESVSKIHFFILPAGLTCE